MTDDPRKRLITALEQLQLAWDTYLTDRDLAALMTELETNPASSERPGAIDWLFWTSLDARQYDAADAIFQSHPDLIFPTEASQDGPLHSALFELHDCPAVLEWLLKHGADRDRRGANGWMPLHVAALNGFVDSARVLLDHGADVDAGTKIDGDITPLMEAATRGQESVVRLLLKRNAVPLRVDHFDGRSAADMAMSSGYPNLAEFIRSWAQDMSCSENEGTGKRKQRQRDQLE